MRPNPKPRLKSRRRTPRFAARAGALAALTTSVPALLLAAPSSLALGVHAQQQAHRPRGFHRAVASWYWDDGLSTACGFSVKYGVANRTLPCGTRVKFRFHGHRVTATVDDRGPYIAGRNWDLDEHTAAALHFSGVHPLWVKKM
ncbi:MAG: RlpA-like double-psi beta-barrel domain-containing protein [Solirubrobacterales bacterium]|nr:RlpA-like double-psi beta-barrel domain-containing protein [Solirubrobacterales bacterium]